MARNEESLISIFDNFCASINKTFIFFFFGRGRGYTLGYHSKKFRKFPDIFSLLNILATREATCIHHIYN